MLTPRSPEMLDRIRERLVPALVIGAVVALVVLVHLVENGGSGGKTDKRALPRVPPVTRSAARRRMEAAERHAIQRTLAYVPYISRGSSKRREVAITFDDGPGPATHQILHVLHRYHVPATFFQVGRMIRSFPLLAREVVADGDAAGLHTNNHARLLGMPFAFQRGETDPRNEMIPGYGPNFVQLFRPPYGAFGRKTMAIMRERHTLMVLWSVNTFDYMQPGVKAIVKRAVKGAFPGAIVLMHDAGGYSRAETVRALPAIVKGIRRRGFKLVTVPRMVLDAAPPRHQPPAVGPG